MMRPVTLKDVALRAGVSPKTVSRVINGEQHVRPEVRDAVQAIVDELDYRPNAFARSLSSSRSYLLGLFLDDPGSGYAADLQLGALMRCRERSYHLVVEPVDVTAPGWPGDIVDTIRALRLDGVILAPPICDDVALLDRLDQQALPYVRISPRDDRERSGMVDMDERAAAHEMTEHLIGLGTATSASSRATRRTVRRQSGSTAFAPRWRAPGSTCGRTGSATATFRSAAACGSATRCCAATPSRPRSSPATMTWHWGVLVTAMRLGIAVPDRLSVAGFDDAPTSRAAWPPITTIRQPKGDMAASAVDILVDPRYRPWPTEATFRRRLDYELIARLSTGPVRAG